MTLLTEIENSTSCLCSAYAVVVAEKQHRTGNTPNRVIRVSDEDWTAYGEAVAALGSNRSDDLRRHIKATITAYRREQRRAEREA